MRKKKYIALLAVLAVSLSTIACSKGKKNIVPPPTEVVTTTTAAEAEETTTIAEVEPSAAAGGETVLVNTGITDIEVPVNSLSTLNSLLSNVELKNSIEDFLFDMSFTPIEEEYSFDGAVARIPTEEGYTVVIDAMKGSIDIEN